VTGQPDQPRLPDPADEVAEAARSLPGRPGGPAEVGRPGAPAEVGRPGGRPEPARDRPAPPDQRHIDHRPAGSVNEQLLERLWRLPPGHPSSPYDGDGKLRPPVPDPRQFERPLPGEEGYDGPEPASLEPARAAAGQPRELPDGQSKPDAAPDAAPDAWRRALPGLQDMWQEHERKWPESERLPADRSGDEPGSWRGDSGHYLNAEENLVSGHAMERVSEVEKKTTPVLLYIKAEVPGTELAGLEHRLKGEERFKEKVAAELRAKPERPIGLISDNMPDAMRYTYQFSADTYASSYWDVHRSLGDQGYTLEFRRNSWDNSQYKGLNTRWRTPEGQLFEIQFHTPESFEAKQLTHKAYERIRSPMTSDQEREELYNYQAEVSSNVPAPSGALTIPDYREEKH